MRFSHQWIKALDHYNLSSMVPFLSLLLLLLVSGNLMAQDSNPDAQERKFEIGIAGSLLRNNYSGIDEILGVGFESRFNYSMGLVGQFSLTYRLLLRTGALYTKREYDIVSVVPETMRLFARLITDQKYLEIPVIAAYQVKDLDKIEVYVTGGLIGVFRIQEPFSSLNDANRIYGYRSTIWTTHTGIAVIFETNGRASILVEPQVRFHLNDIHKSEFSIIIHLT